LHRGRRALRAALEQYALDRGYIRPDQSLAEREAER